MIDVNKYLEDGVDRVDVIKALFLDFAYNDDWIESLSSLEQFLKQMDWVKDQLKTLEDDRDYYREKYNRIVIDYDRLKKEREWDSD